MIDLDQLVLRFAAGAKEVRLMTGQPVTVRTPTGVDLVTQHSITPRDIVAAMANAGLAEHLPSRDVDAKTIDKTIEGIEVRITISRKKGQLKVRIAPVNPVTVAPPKSSTSGKSKKRRTFSDEGGPAHNVDRVRVPDSVSPIVPTRDGRPSRSPGESQTPARPRPSPPAETPREAPPPRADPTPDVLSAEESGALDWTAPELNESEMGPALGVELSDGSLLIDPADVRGAHSPPGGPEALELELEADAGMPGIELGDLGDLGGESLGAASSAAGAPVEFGELELDRPTAPAQPAPQHAAGLDAPAAAPSEGVTPAPAYGQSVSADQRPRRPDTRTSRRLNSAMSTLLASARERMASDVHFTTGEAGRVRIAGRLIQEGRQWGEAELRAAIDQIMPPGGDVDLTQNGHVDFALDVDGAGRVRVNVSRQRRGLKLSLRIVDDAPRSFEALGLPPEIEKITHAHQGLAVVAGPSGHGKTTTLAAIVDLINASHPVHLITVEDPVEILHRPKEAVISQREVGAHTLSFGAALKGALREDPDVIVIGELRDRETVEIAVEAAETGHLVLATMSTPNGPRTIDRLIELFPPAEQSQVRATLAGALKMVIAQRLVPSADGGRRHAAVEMISGNVPLWALIRDDKLIQLSSLMQRGRRYGMITIEESLRELVASGAIDRATAAAWADDPREFEGALS